MCLNKKYNTPPEPRGFGWKILRVVDQPTPCAFRDEPLKIGLYSNCYPEAPWTNEWKHADMGNGVLGEPGFHIYKIKEEAEKTLDALDVSPYRAPVEKVVRVEYDEAFMEGEGDGGWNLRAKVVLAKKARLADDQGN